jgi:hypothetical protein
MMNDDNNPKNDSRRRDKAMMFYLSDGEKEMLKKLAEHYNLSMSETIRWLIQDKTHQLEIEMAVREAKKG